MRKGSGFIENIQNIQVARLFKLGEQKCSNETSWIISEQHDNFFSTIGTLTLNCDKSLTFDIVDKFKDVYSQEDLEDIVIEKISKQKY